jgi:predicted nucleotidyltransferase
MRSDEIIATLRRHEAELHRQGVAHAALFGSVARGEARTDSDIDILIDLDPSARLSVFDYVGVKEYIAGLFERPVDVVNRAGLKPHIRPAVLTEVVHAF